MHEFSLAGKLLEKALDVSRTHGGLAIEQVSVDIGTLSHVVPETLVFAFEASTPGTVADGAVLDWRKVPAKVRCDDCGTVFEPEDVFWLCPECEAPGGEILEGADVILHSVRLRDETPASTRG